MDDDLFDITCPVCDEKFSVIWSSTYEGQSPEYCPFCGNEMDYDQEVTE